MRCLFAASCISTPFLALWWSAGIWIGVTLANAGWTRLAAGIVAAGLLVWAYLTAPRKLQR